MPNWLYAIVGLWVRREACQMTAIALSALDPEEAVCPKAWSLTVFFEAYMLQGADGTAKDFGPKEPAELKVVETA